MAVSLPISLLPDDACAKLLSASELTSPERVVEGLLTNALDAGAQSIVIVADFARGYISIQDDGTGIKEVEFSEEGHLAQSNCTH